MLPNSMFMCCSDRFRGRFESFCPRRSLKPSTMVAQCRSTLSAGTWNSALSLKTFAGSFGSPIGGPPGP